MAAQSWEATSHARGWAKQDKDDSFTFFDPATRTLHTWMREGGLTGSLSVGALEGAPVRWVLDPRNNAWVAHENLVSQIDKTGRVLAKFKTPAEVGDVCWDLKGFVLSYRTPEPYLEKRDYKGTLLWSSGVKPARTEGPAPLNRRPVVLQDSGNVLMVDGKSLNLVIFDGENGKQLSVTDFHLNTGEPAPLIEGTTVDLEPLALWPGKDVVFAAVKASQLPPVPRAAFQGLVLARFDFAFSRLELLPTGLDEAHILVGVLDSEALFVSPNGGLKLVKIR
jgi:hypothetical protein